MPNQILLQVLRDFVLYKFTVDINTYVQFSSIELQNLCFTQS